MKRAVKIILISLFGLMMLVGIFVLGSLAHQGSGDCALLVLFGECVPTNDVLATLEHHSSPYQVLTGGVSRIAVLGLGLFLLLGLFFLKHEGEDGVLSSGPISEKVYRRGLLWREEFLTWLVLKREDSLR